MFRGVILPIFQNQVVNPNIRKVACDNAAVEAALTKAPTEAFGYLESLKPEDSLPAGCFHCRSGGLSNLILFHYLGHRLEQRGSRNFRPTSGGTSARRRCNRRSRTRRRSRSRWVSTAAGSDSVVTQACSRRILPRWIRQGAGMLDHIGLKVTDIKRSKAFYDKALEPLGVGVIMDVQAEGDRRHAVSGLWRRLQAIFLDQRAAARDGAATCRVRRAEPGEGG